MALHHVESSWTGIESVSPALAGGLPSSGPPVSESESHSVVSDSLQPHGLSMEFSRPEYWSG